MPLDFGFPWHTSQNCNFDHEIIGEFKSIAKSIYRSIRKGLSGFKNSQTGQTLQFSVYVK